MLVQFVGGRRDGEYVAFDSPPPPVVYELAPAPMCYVAQDAPIVPTLPRTLAYRLNRVGTIYPLLRDEFTTDVDLDVAGGWRYIADALCS